MRAIAGRCCLNKEVTGRFFDSVMKLKRALATVLSEQLAGQDLSQHSALSLRVDMDALGRVWFALAVR